MVEIVRNCRAGGEVLSTGDKLTLDHNDAVTLISGGQAVALKMNPKQTAEAIEASKPMKPKKSK